MSGLNELELRHLVALDAVAAEGTFGRAASRLGYTQSAVSQQIAALERLVDGKVFDRPGGPRPVELTPLGHRLLDGARDLIGRVNALDQDLERFRSGEIGHLRVGTFQSVSATLLPTIIGQLRQRHPEVEISLMETDVDDELHEALLGGELDVSFLVGDGPPGTELIPLLADPFVVMARPDQFTGPVPVEQLDQEPLIGQVNTCQLRTERDLQALGLEPEYVFHSNDNTTVAAMVRAGLGVAVLPLLCIEPDDTRIALHAIDPELPDRPIGLAWRSDRTLAPVAEHFIELAQSTGTEVAARSWPVQR